MGNLTSSEALRRSIKGFVLCSTLMYVVFIFTLTHMPLDSVSQQPWFKYSSGFWLDKIVQCILYSGLVGLMGCAMFPLNRDVATTIESISPVRTMALVLLIVVIAFLDEFTQPWFGRRCELLDIAADVGAVIPGFCLFLILNETRHMLLSGDF